MTFLTRQTVYAATIVFLYEEPVFQLFVLLSTSICYNCVLAWCRPFYQVYNMTLHYINELAFFFFLAMSMTFTDFVSDVITRTRIGTMLTTFMFMVLSVNIVVCLLAIIWVQRKQTAETKEAIKKVILPEEIESEKVARFERAFKNRL
jgi:hypothetical protein